MRVKLFFLVCATIFLLAVAACGPSQPELDSTATAVAVAVYQTQTAEAPPPTNTATPVPPTDTPTPIPTDTPTATPTDTPTRTPTPDYLATSAFKSTATMEAVIAMVDQDLQLVGLSTDRGRLAWMGEEPEILALANYNTHNWVPLGGDTSFSDFVLRADVTWDSTSGLAICGFWFRGESLDKDSEHYTFEAVRLSGLPAWSINYWRYNRIQSSLTGGIKTSPEIQQDSMDTNEYIFVAEGNLLSIYVNGESLGSVTINKLRDGYVTYYIRQESGNTTCIFDNAWIWDLTE